MEVTNSAEGAHPKRALHRQQGESAKEHGCRIPKVELTFIGREKRKPRQRERMEDTVVLEAPQCNTSFWLRSGLNQGGSHGLC